MRIKTSKGSITTSEEIAHIIYEALVRAAEFEKEKSHLYDHDAYKKLSEEVKPYVWN